MIGTIRFDSIDRPFRWETPGIWAQTVARWAREGLPADAADSHNKLIEFLGFDRLDWVPVGSWTADLFYPLFEQKIIEDDGHIIIIQGTDGVTKKVLKENPEMSMPQFLKFPVETIDDYIREIEWRLNPEDEARFPAGWLSKKHDLASRDYPLGLFVIGPFGHLRNLMGEENLMYALYDDRGLIKYMMNKWRDFYTKFISKLCKTAVPEAIMVWEDMCYKNGPLMSPELFRELLLPGLRDIMDQAKSLGIEGLWVDNDGNCEKMIPLYLDAGANGFYPFECKAGMDIVEIRRQYGKRFTIIGGIEKHTLSDEIQYDDMIIEINSKVVPMFELGGYIPMLDHTAPPNIPFKRFMGFLDHVRGLPEKHGKWL